MYKLSERQWKVALTSRRFDHDVDMSPRWSWKIFLNFYCRIQLLNADPVFFEDELLNGGFLARNVDLPEFECFGINVAKFIGILLLDFLLEV